MVRLVESMTDDHPARPVLVLSNDPAADGLVRAQALGVTTAVVDHREFVSRAAFEAELIRALDEARPDILCLAGFMRILTVDFTGRYAGRLLNIHPSLLPRYPGLQTHRRALAAGDTRAGATVHLVTPELDAGPILGQARVPVLPDDDEAALAARVLVAEHQLYPTTLRRFAAGDCTRQDLPDMTGDDCQNGD